MSVFAKHSRRCIACGKYLKKTETTFCLKCASKTYTEEDKQQLIRQVKGDICDKLSKERQLRDEQKGGYD